MAELQNGQFVHDCRQVFADMLQGTRTEDRDVAQKQLTAMESQSCLFHGTKESIEKLTLLGSTTRPIKVKLTNNTLVIKHDPLDYDIQCEKIGKLLQSFFKENNSTVMIKTYGVEQADIDIIINDELTEKQHVSVIEMIEDGKPWIMNRFHENCISKDKSKDANCKLEPIFAADENGLNLQCSSADMKERFLDSLVGAMIYGKVIKAKDRHFDNIFIGTRENRCIVFHIDFDKSLDAPQSTKKQCINGQLQMKSSNQGFDYASAYNSDIDKYLRSHKMFSTYEYKMSQAAKLLNQGKFFEKNKDKLDEILNGKNLFDILDTNFHAMKQQRKFDQKEIDRKNLDHWFGAGYFDIVPSVTEVDQAAKQQDCQKIELKYDQKLERRYPIRYDSDFNVSEAIQRFNNRQETQAEASAKRRVLLSVDENPGYNYSTSSVITSLVLLIGIMQFFQFMFFRRN